MVELFLGRRTATATLAAASKPDERCEAQYYIGEWYLLHDDKTAAPPALEAAADTCPKNFDEYQLAQAELAGEARGAASPHRVHRVRLPHAISKASRPHEPTGTANNFT